MPEVADAQMPPEFDLQSYLTAKRVQVNAVLETFCKNANAPQRIVAAMHYSLTAGGKRLRPILCLAAAEAVGGRCDDVLDAACALEMVHTYSLIHDDLPAMDDDQLRRGKPTCHVAFDEATAILAGDALLTLAFETLAREGAASNPQKRLGVIQILANAAGSQGMIGGQMLDISSEGRSMNLQELEHMHRMKTGALIEASVWIGAELGNGTARQIEKLKEYGRSIGLAFQITDDILNVEGDPNILGKAVGTDHHRKKSTYPSLLGLDASKALAARTRDEALKALEIFDKKADPLRDLARYIIERRR